MGWDFPTRVTEVLVPIATTLAINQLYVGMDGFEKLLFSCDILYMHDALKKIGKNILIIHVPGEVL